VNVLNSIIQIKMASVVKFNINVNFISIYFILHIIVMLAGSTIYKSSENVLNVSYLNSPPSPISFIPSPPPHSWNSFSGCHFYFCLYVYTVFAPYSSSCTLSSPLPPIHWYNPSPHTQDLFYHPVLWLYRK
jgi:hypothetical protein